MPPTVAVYCHKSFLSNALVTHICSLFHVKHAAQGPIVAANPVFAQSY